MDCQHSQQAGVLDLLPNLRTVKDALASRRLDQLPPEYLPPDGESFSLAVQRLSAERVKIYLDAIDRQNSLEMAGLERVELIRTIFNFYANTILGGAKWAAIKDMQQQQTDLAIMTSFSHSFMRHAEALGVEQFPQSYAGAKQKVGAQFAALSRFNQNAKDEDHSAIASADNTCIYTPQQANEYLEKFGIVTFKVAHLNIELASLNQVLFNNIARSLAVWMRMLEENVSSTLLTSFYPKSDVEYELGLSELALERVEAYARRGQSLSTLVNKCNSRYEDLWRGDCTVTKPTRSL